MFNGPQISVEFDDSREFFTNGDFISGRVTVESSKSFTVHEIRAKLCCQDVAMVVVPDAQGSHTEQEKEKHLELIDVLFPTEDVRANVDSEHPGSSYTMQAGKHEFKFRFQIPIEGVYPQSFEVPHAGSGVRWYVKGKLDKGHLLSRSKRDVKRFEMCPSVLENYENGEDVIDSSLTKTMNVYSSPDVDSKTSSSLWRSLIPPLTERHQADVSCTLYWQMGGIHQTPSPLNVYFGVESEFDSSLLLRSFTLQLKRKMTVIVRRNSNPYKKVYPLIELKDINAKSLKEGLQIVGEALSACSIKERIPSTFTNKHFSIDYKLVAIARISSKGRPKSTQKFRISTPVYICPYLAQNVSENGQSNGPPAYSVGKNPGNLDNQDMKIVKPTLNKIGRLVALSTKCCHS